MVERFIDNIVLTVFSVCYQAAVLLLRAARTNR
jgi:hypothetical protein